MSELDFIGKTESSSLKKPASLSFLIVLSSLRVKFIYELGFVFKVRNDFFLGKIFFKDFDLQEVGLFDFDL